MRIRVPAKRVREKFQLKYELQGVQRAINYLCQYHEVPRIRVVLNGRKVGKGDDACYYENKAYFTKRGLKKGTGLPELYHHLVEAKGVEAKGLEMPMRKEEKEANTYAKVFLG